MRVSVFSCGLVVVAAAMLLLLPAVQMQADAFSVYVPAKDEQCFFEEVSKGEKVVGSYWVAEGGNLDVDLRVLGPDGKIVYERERTQDGSFQFKAQKEGMHTLCLDNRMSTVSGKTVNFHLYDSTHAHEWNESASGGMSMRMTQQPYVGDALHRKDAASSTSLSPLESAIVKTAEGMHVMRDAAFYNKARYERHAETVNSTNARILFWTAINYLCIVVVAGAQVWAIRGFFEKKRKA